MATLRLQGMGTALVTPFKDNDSVDYRALEQLVDYQLSNGADYLVVLGTTAETPTLTADEKQRITDTVISRTAGRKPIVLGVGGNCTRTVTEQLSGSALDGIDAILSVVPYYNKPTQEGLYRHYKAISEATSLPIILYNVPGRTGVNMEAETTLRIAHDCPNVLAVKEASGNIARIGDIIRNKPAGFSLISGDDGLTLPLITMGAIGVISVIGNAVPQEFGQMVRCALSGDTSQARSIHHRLSELFTLLFIDGNPAGVKAMLHAMGLVENRLRLPLVPTGADTFQKIRDVLLRLDIRC